MKPKIRMLTLSYCATIVVCTTAINCNTVYANSNNEIEGLDFSTDEAIEKFFNTTNIQRTISKTKKEYFLPLDINGKLPIEPLTDQDSDFLYNTTGKNALKRGKSYMAQEAFVFVPKSIGVKQKTQPLSDIPEGGIAIYGPGINRPIELTYDGISFAHKTYITFNGIDANNQKITHVQEGEIAQNSQDAINGSQLWGQLQKINANTTLIYNMGALSAALAGLQPLPFDKDHRFSMTASVGHFKGQNAVAIGGGYYLKRNFRINGGVALRNLNDRMLNVGVAYRLGGDSDSDDFIRTNELSHSRAEIARLTNLLEQSQNRELEVLAKLQKMEKMQKEINELKSLISKNLKIKN